MKAPRTVILDGEEFILVPRAQYLKMTGAPKGAVEALTYGRSRLSESLRKAREHAGLTQEALAAKMGKSQPMVSGAETGRIRVSSAYVKAVLKACGLPADWAPGVPPKARKTATTRPAKRAASA